MKNDQKFLLEKIRSQYTEEAHTALDALRALDRRVARPAVILAYTLGTVATLVFGTGMCLAMQVIGNAMLPGIALGFVGLAAAVLNYPLYKKVLNARRRTFTPQIMALCEQLENQND
ncbi:MAG: MotA/TolQ/ExbB proton channel family protein [Ruminococcaceae bacterium]|nr:MotA/TolQ/ExbB proton channel family protein [Oscillospiraceae bacterium]